MQKLFKFVGLDHGAWIQSNLKISIQDIKRGEFVFRYGQKIGVSLVIRSDKKKLIEKCLADIIKFVKKKKIKIIINK